MTIAHLFEETQMELNECCELSFHLYGNQCPRLLTPEPSEYQKMRNEAWHLRIHKEWMPIKSTT